MHWGVWYVCKVWSRYEKSLYPLRRIKCVFWLVRIYDKVWEPLERLFLNVINSHFAKNCLHVCFTRVQILDLICGVNVSFFVH